MQSVCTLDSIQCVHWSIPSHLLITPWIWDGFFLQYESCTTFIYCPLSVDDNDGNEIVKAAWKRKRKLKAVTWQWLLSHGLYFLSRPNLKTDIEQPSKGSFVWHIGSTWIFSLKIFKDWERWIFDILLLNLSRLWWLPFVFPFQG